MEIVASLLGKIETNRFFLHQKICEVFSFRGEEPGIDALLRRNGIVKTER